MKPAIKEHFIYRTKVKAWRADTRDQLRAAYRGALEVVPPDEIIVQEMVPGDGAVAARLLRAVQGRRPASRT